MKWIISLPDISLLCLTCCKFNYLIGQNGYFWELKFIMNFKFIGKSHDCWKFSYKLYVNNIWIFGLNDFGQLLLI
jgi:hypothetical protein